MKRLVPLLLFGLVCSALFAAVSAQELTEPTPEASSLDQLPPGATPMPLPTMMSRPIPSSRVTEGDVTLELFFDALPQGETGLLRVEGANLTGARSRFLDEAADFYPIPGDGYYGLLAIGMEQTPRAYPLDVFVTRGDGVRTVIHAEVQVVLGGFIRQDVTIPQTKVFLVNSDIERSELARLESIFSTLTPERAWNEEGFQMPILSTLTSPFGAFRTFNSTLNTRHTGWDIRTTLGVPVMASAGGRVAYAGLMDIRGNYVVIDHGYGVYSGYAHLSQIHVTRGQTVTRGQIIGMTGDTGRTSGPHFHWEMAVNGQWVDSVRFLEMWQP